MPLSIPSGLTDDNDFVALVGAVVSGVVAENQVDQVWIIQIDNWFDHKWLRFSGNRAIASPMFAGVWTTTPLFDRLDTVKEPHSRSKLTFPPFSPGRILGQWSFVRDSRGHFAEFPFPSIPHKTEKARSATNLHRLVDEFCGSACFAWFSANTITNDRGSLMVYTTKGAQVSSWYAAFRREGRWAVSQSKGISIEDVRRLEGAGLSSR